jgi:hypothetical protein
VTDAEPRPKFLLTSRAQSTIGRSLLTVAVGLASVVALLKAGLMVAALVVLLLIWVVFFWPTKLVVAPAELEISWLGIATRIPYAELAHATVYEVSRVPFGVQLTTRGGKAMRLPVFRPVLRAQRQILRAVLGAIAKAQTAAGFPTSPVEIPSIPPPGRR